MYPAIIHKSVLLNLACLIKDARYLQPIVYREPTPICANLAQKKDISRPYIDGEGYLPTARLSGSSWAINRSTRGVAT